MVTRRMRLVGFSIAVLMAMGVIVILSTVIRPAHNHERRSSVVGSSPVVSLQTAKDPEAVSTQPTIQSNSMYGFSFYLPPNWKTSGDSKFDPKLSATRQEFGISLAPNNGSSAVDIEVLDEPLQSAEAWYDQYYAQTPIKVSKTTNTLKNKQAILYDFVAPTYETKLYLFALGSKTYLFSSVNESINTSASDSYWASFDDIFNSLAFQR